MRTVARQRPLCESVAVTGGSLIGIVLLSMSWLFGIGGLLLNWQVWRLARRAKPDEHVPSGIPFLPGVVASLAVFLTLPLLDRHLALEIPWPFLWIMLPLLLDMQGAGAFVAAALGFGRTVVKDDSARREPDDDAAKL